MNDLVIKLLRQGAKSEQGKMILNALKEYTEKGEKPKIDTVSLPEEGINVEKIDF